MAQSDLGVRERGPGELQLPVWPVSVRSMALQERDTRSKVKIRYPFSRSSRRPKMKRQINIQMAKQE